MLYEIIITNGAYSLRTYIGKNLQETSTHFILSNLTKPGNEISQVKIPKQFALVIEVKERS